MPFKLLAAGVEERFADDTRFDKKSGLGCLGTLGAMLFLFIAGRLVFDARPFPAWLNKTMLVLFIGEHYTLYQMFIGPRRFLNTTVIPGLTRALKPLAPNREELKDCLEKMAGLGFRIGKKVKLTKLWSSIERE